MSSIALLDLLATVRPPYVAGASSSNRFQFQLSWALCRILHLHQSGAGYALLLDYHDDVVELDDATNPTAVDFYQVKSQATGSWTVKRLIARSNGKTTQRPSILGKLASHRKSFAQTRSTGFVSNCPIKIPLLPPKRAEELEEFLLSETETVPRGTICDAVEAEVQFVIDEPVACTTRFIRTPLTHNDHDFQCLGRTATFIEKYAHPLAPVGPFYKMLRSELTRKNNEELRAANSSDLASKKLFGRAHLDQLLALVCPETSLLELLTAIQQNLIAEVVPFKRRQDLVAACREMAAERLNAANRIVLEMAAEIETAIARWTNASDSTPLMMQVLVFLRSAVDVQLLVAFEAIYSAIAFDSLSLLMLHEHFQLPPSPTKPANQTP